MSSNFKKANGASESRAPFAGIQLSADGLVTSVTVPSGVLYAVTTIDIAFAGRSDYATVWRNATPTPLTSGVFVELP